MERRAKDKAAIRSANVLRQRDPYDHLSNAEQKSTATMFSFTNFDDVFAFDPDCYYDEAAVREIELNRKKLEGLFVERVMKLLGIKRRKSNVFTMLKQQLTVLFSSEILSSKDK